MLLLKAVDLFPLEHPLHVLAAASHLRELDRLQFTVLVEPGNRIRADPKLAGSFFSTEQHTLLAFYQLALSASHEKPTLGTAGRTFLPSPLPFKGKR